MYKLILVDPRPFQPLQPDRLLAVHAALREADDQPSGYVRVDDSTNFRAAFCSCLVLPVEKAHGAAREVAVAAAVVGLQIKSRRERVDVAEPKALVDGVRRDGYFRYFKLNVPMCKDVLVLRSLALRGRATTASPVLQFVIDSPNEIAWNVLSFWRASC